MDELVAWQPSLQHHVERILGCLPQTDKRRDFYRNKTISSSNLINLKSTHSLRKQKFYVQITPKPVDDIKTNTIFSKGSISNTLSWYMYLSTTWHFTMLFAQLQTATIETFVPKCLYFSFGAYCDTNFFNISRSWVCTALLHSIQFKTKIIVTPQFTKVT
jgi:hypothetical protein